MAHRTRSVDFLVDVLKQLTEPGCSMADFYSRLSSTADCRLFRFGFLCWDATNPPPGYQALANVCREWHQTQYGNLVVLRHPETRLQHCTDGNRHLILLGDAFVAAGESNQEPLSILAGAESETGFFEELDRLSGRFALLIIGKDAGRVFHDPIGSRTLFYRDNGAFVLGTHAMLVAMAFGAPQRQDIQALLASSSYRNLKVELLPGDATLFEDVYALPPNHYFDILKCRIVRYWPRYPRRNASFDEFFTAMDNYLRNFVGFLHTPYRPIVGITGGVDSRTLVTAFSHYGLQFRGVTWTNLNFHPWEAGAVSRILRRLKFQRDIVDRSNDQINTAAWFGVYNSGGYRNPSPVVAGMDRLYTKVPGAVFVRGFGGEVIRGFYRLAKGPVRTGPMRDSSTDEMFRMYAEGAKDRSELDPVFKRTALSAFEGFWRRGGYNELEQFGFDVNDIFYWEHRVGNWASASINAMDPAVNSLAGFNCRSVFQIAYGLENNVRMRRELFIEVIRRYNSSVAAIPHGPSRMPHGFADLKRVLKGILLTRFRP
jgi:hypothetical protein